MDQGGRADAPVQLRTDGQKLEVKKEANWHNYWLLIRSDYTEATSLPCFPFWHNTGVWEEWDLFQPAAFPWEHVPVLLLADQFEPPGEYHRWCSNEVSSPEVWEKWLPIVLFSLLFYLLFSLRSSRPLYLSFYSFSSVKIRKMWLSSAWWARWCRWWTRCRLFLEKIILNTLT